MSTAPGTASSRFQIPAHRRGLVYVASAALLWSSSGLFIKLLNLGGFQIAGIRSLVAGLTILAIMAWRREPLGLRLDALNLGCAAAYAGVLILFVLATKLTAAANAIFLQFSAPIYLLFLEPWLNRTRIQRRELVAVAACLLGMSLFFVGHLSPGGLRGNLLGVASGVSLAVFSLLLKHRSRVQPGEHPVGAIVLGNLLVFLLCLALDFKGFLGLRPGAAQAGMLLYLGVVQIGIAYILFAAGMRYASATGAMITSMLEAVFNPVWVFLGTGERPSPWALAGGLLILVVIGWYNLRPSHVDVVAG